MKTGIITFHKANNLGAVLQAYALQKKVSSITNTETEIIDYDNGSFKESSGSKSVKGILKSVYYIIKNHGFEKFRKNYLSLSDRYTRQNISECNKIYDTIICGSDQIWNLGCSDFDYNYFLEFADTSIKKIAYAASLGTYRYTDDERKKVFELIKDFRLVSIREESSLDEFDCCNKDIEITPDPVFLLTQQEWHNIIPKRQTSKKYVLVYLIQDDVNVMRSAQKYAQENDCVIISNKKSLKFMLNNSPEKFLSWIKYADAVFTNSFHGTAFSLIFGKKLGADIEIKDGKTNNRVLSVLDATGNKDCIINKEKYLPEQVTNPELIDKLRNTGIEFLKRI